MRQCERDATWDSRILASDQHNLMRRLIPASIGVVGIVLLIPGAWSLIYSVYSGRVINSEDASVALTPVLSVPLKSILRVLDSKLVIPDTTQWRRIRRDWGEPEFVIAAIAPDRQVAYCLGTLDINVVVNQQGKPVPLTFAGAPYGYSSDCLRSAFRFQAAPGTELEMRIYKFSESPTGNLIVVADWRYTKDKLVGVQLDAELQPRIKSMSVVGLVLVAIAGYLLRRRASQQHGN